MENQELLIPESIGMDVAKYNDIDQDAFDDIEEVRQNYKTLLEKGNDALDTAASIIESSEHPRAIEVFSGLISNLANVNKQLIELHKSKKELREARKMNDDQSNGNNIQNNMFIGSPKDLLDMLMANNG